MKKIGDPQKKTLDDLYQRYNTYQSVDDPIHYPHRFVKAADIEITAFLAALVAYGNVAQIRGTIDKLSAVLTDSPSDFISGSMPRMLAVACRGIYHRFFTEADFYYLLLSVRAVLKQYGSLGNCFPEVGNGPSSLKSAVSKYQELFLNTAARKFDYISPGFKFMFPLPERGSACKRMNLFLRWMVRSDKVDFGLWNHVEKARLIIPVDTHIARVGQMLGFTRRKQADWRMAEEITAALARFDPDDPVKYDFSLCHWGMDNRKKQ